MKKQKQKNQKESKRSKNILMDNSFVRSFTHWKKDHLFVILHDFFAYGSVLLIIMIAGLMINPLLEKLATETQKVQNFQTLLELQGSNIADNALTEVQDFPTTARLLLAGIAGSALLCTILLILLFNTFQYFGWSAIHHYSIKIKNWWRYLLPQIYLFIISIAIGALIMWLLKGPYDIYATIIILAFSLMFNLFMSASYTPEKTGWQNFKDPQMFAWKNVHLILIAIFCLLLVIFALGYLYVPVNIYMEKATVPVAIIFLMLTSVWIKNFIALMIEKKRLKHSA